jgi:hypothetical protein
MKYDIPRSKLLELNETYSQDDLHEGDIIFLEKKKRKYYGSQDYYHVYKDESLYHISQQFGIRISNLARMNNLTIFSIVSEGDKIRLK